MSLISSQYGSFIGRRYRLSTLALRAGFTIICRGDGWCNQCSVVMHQLACITEFTCWDSYRCGQWKKITVVGQRWLCSVNNRYYGR